MSELQKNILIGAPSVLAAQPHEADAIVLSHRIEADPRRLFHAVSIPEYIEAWVQAPDLEELLVFEYVTHERFQIDLYREDAPRASIHGSARIVNKTQVNYIWKTISPNGITHTTVDLTLMSGLDRCVLGLRHNGFHNTVERAWHSRMWMHSMKRLCGIIRTSN
jgi:uncharacterized protein YndB with AHSA1/START domain